MGRYHAIAMNPITSSPSTLAPAGVLLARQLAVASVLGLVLLGLAWELWLAPLRPGGSWWAIKVLPLTLAMPGLLKLRMYTYRWVSLAVWLYFTEACVRGWSDPWPANALAMVQGGLCLLLFVACGMHVRTRFKSVREATERASA